MFRGEYALSMDPKGRIAIPSRYRERLAEQCGSTLVATISLQERCLSIYPLPDWQRIERDLNALPAFDRQAQAIRHLLIGHASDCEADSHGRILIAPTLRKFAGLEKRVKMVGQISKFELWDESAWETRREEMLGQVSEILSDPSTALQSLVF